MRENPALCNFQIDIARRPAVGLIDLEVGSCTIRVQLLTQGLIAIENFAAPS